jgi:hypothetical protein
MNVSITFQSPAQEHTQTPASLHERCLESVPRANAEQMAKDFVEYQSDGEGARRKLYRYESADGECLIALDFEEIVAVVAGDVKDTSEADPCQEAMG